MKQRSFLTGALVAALVHGVWAAAMLVGPMALGCPDDDTDCGKGGGGSGNGSNDPAFVMKDRTVKTALVQQQAILQAQQPLKKPSELIAVEQAHYQAYVDAVKKTPAEAFQKAVEIWKANDSADLQRLVLFRALEKVNSTEESEALQFMLKALDAPEAQRGECARLGRGNSLEKSIAAKRIALLESNPKLRTAAVSNK